MRDTDPPATFARFCAVPSRQVDWERMDICMAERQAVRQLARHPLEQMPVSGSRHVTARRSGHDIQHTQPRLVLREVRRVVAAVRVGRRRAW